MNLSALIRGQLPAASKDGSAASVAGVATVAVANTKEQTPTGNHTEREIRFEKFCAGESATAIPATPATHEPDEAATAARRHRVLALLSDPAVRLAVVVDDADADPVRVMVGVRRVATAELEIPREFYNFATLLELLDQHSMEAGDES